MSQKRTNNDSGEIWDLGSGGGGEEELGDILSIGDSPKAILAH